MYVIKSICTEVTPNIDIRVYTVTTRPTMVVNIPVVRIIKMIPIVIKTTVPRFVIRNTSYMENVLLAIKNTWMVWYIRNWTIRTPWLQNIIIWKEILVQEKSMLLWLLLQQYQRFWLLRQDIILKPSGSCEYIKFDG
jgi:hypothetical protein